RPLLVGARSGAVPRDPGHHHARRPDALPFQLPAVSEPVLTRSRSDLLPHLSLPVPGPGYGPVATAPPPRLPRGRGRARSRVLPGDGHAAGAEAGAHQGVRRGDIGLVSAGAGRRLRRDPGPKQDPAPEHAGSLRARGASKTAAGDLVVAVGEDPGGTQTELLPIDGGSEVEHL